MFRRNSKDSITAEVSLPKINETIYYFDFSNRERLFYDSLDNNNTADNILKQI
jgi:hypothetical protein